MMIVIISKRFFLYLYILLVSILFAACHALPTNNKQTDDEQANMRSAYDDSTLNRNILPVLMPYNRIIDPAGKVVYFGDLDEENHSMDVTIIPGNPQIAVEDRYGIVIIDTITSKIVTRWSYNASGQYKGLTSTYSGLKVIEINKEINIFWSAAAGKGKNSKSYAFQAIINNGRIIIKNTFSFKPEGESPLALPNDVAINKENGAYYLYVVLNGNNQLVKIDLKTNKTIWTRATGVAPYGITIAQNKAFVTNWAGPEAVDTVNRETAGVPYGKTYIDPKTGATAQGTIMVFGLTAGDV
jgi:hypothetical protein